MIKAKTGRILFSLISVQLLLIIFFLYLQLKGMQLWIPSNRAKPGAFQILSIGSPALSSKMPPAEPESDRKKDGAGKDSQRVNTAQKHGTATLENATEKARGGNFSATRVDLQQDFEKSHVKALPSTIRKAVNQSNSVLHSKSPKSNDNQLSTDYPRRYLLRGYKGRLGNILFQFASAYCIAKLNNLTLVVKDVRVLKDLHHHDFLVRKPSWTPDTPVQRQPPSHGCDFHPSLMNLQPNTSSHSLGGYSQSWKYFEPCKAKVKEAIRFKDSIVQQAVSIVAELRKKLPGQTLVGVHVRREDYLKLRDGKKPAPPEYYHRAMEYFRSKFRDVCFVVITSDQSWFRNNVSHAADVFLVGRHSSPAVDMEVLARMDHVIFSVGTFGWWAGYKNNGTVVGYKDFYVPLSVYGQKMMDGSENFFYPGWIAL